MCVCVCVSVCVCVCMQLYYNKINFKRNIKDKNKYRCKTKSSSGHSILFSNMPIEKKKTLNNDMQFSESRQFQWFMYHSNFSHFATEVE